MNNLLRTFGQREDVGLETCGSCPRLCRHACPVAEAEARETVSPWNLVVTSDLLKRGRIEAESVGELPWHCSSCGACTEACLHGNDVSLWVMLARGRVLGAHASPASIEEVRGHFAVAGNAYGVALGDALDAVVRAAFTSVRPRTGKSVYFPGCATLAESPLAARNLLETSILRGMEEVGIGEVSAMCCGLPLLWAGDLDGFANHARRFAQRSEDLEALIVHDPGCAHALMKRYPEFGVTLAPKVITVLEALGANMSLTEEGPFEDPRVRDGAAPKVAYADTCSCSRALGFVKLPRRVLAHATGELPMELIGPKGAQVDCCGGSGLLPLVAPKTALSMAEAKIAQFRASGAQRLVVASPRCAAHLSKADSSIEVRDITSELSRLG